VALVPVCSSRIPNRRSHTLKLFPIPPSIRVESPGARRHPSSVCRVMAGRNNAPLPPSRFRSFSVSAVLG
jgi:hypothetical protein